jgi:hypothetical protein
MRLWTLHPRYLDSQGLVALWREGLLAQAVLRNRTRGFAFDRRKIGPARRTASIACTTGQLEHEWAHLLAKLKLRDPVLYRRRRRETPEPHPLFIVVPGPKESWEK